MPFLKNWTKGIVRNNVFTLFDFFTLALWLWQILKNPKQSSNIVKDASDNKLSFSPDGDDNPFSLVLRQWRPRIR